MVSFELSARDAVDWLRDLRSQSVDLVITDPAYESLEKHRAIGTTTRLKHSKSSSNDWFNIFPNARFGELFAEVHRVLKDDTHFYLLCDAETMFVAKPEAEKAGFKFWKPLVWDKCTIGMGYHYRARYEFILFFEKGKRRLNDLGIADVMSVPRIRGGEAGGSGRRAHLSELTARRHRRRPVHGIGERRCGRGEAWKAIPW
jgi:site-specific DNA-methyltransferase (adenine-specific)